MDIVLLFPGQGSQRVGMAADLAAAYPEARDVLARADAALGAPLAALMHDGPEDELTLTHNAQPALLAHGAAAWAAIRDAARPHVRAAAGHSLGEFSAYHAAGALTLEAAVRLVRRRGELMYESGVARPGTMAAVLGDPSRPIEDLCAEASAETGQVVVAANHNAPGQTVISGEVGAVERAMALLKGAGAKRAIRLPVSGAFHSPLMEVAAEGLGAALDASGLCDPEFPVYANVTAEPVVRAPRARALLLRQLTSPVGWVAEVEAIAAQFPEALCLEMGPGSVLAGLAKKIAPGLRVVPCGTAADVQHVLELIA